MVWKESLPSPGKSKTLCKIMVRQYSCYYPIEAPCKRVFIVAPCCDPVTYLSAHHAKWEDLHLQSGTPWLRFDLVIFFKLTPSTSVSVISLENGEWRINPIYPLCSSSETHLWPSKTIEKGVDQNRESWRGDDLICCADKMNSYETSSMSFIGPYILCQVGKHQNFLKCFVSLLWWWSSITDFRPTPEHQPELFFFFFTVVFYCHLTVHQSL